MKKCPECGISHENSVLVCDCGFDFTKKVKPVQKTSVQDLNVCPNCKAPVTSFDRICQNCKQPIPEHETANHYVCPKCGYIKNPPEALVCASCGYHLGSGSPGCLMIGTALLMFIWAFLFIITSLFQRAIFQYLSQNATLPFIGNINSSGMTLLTIWNFIVAIAYVVMGINLIQRSRTAYRWALWTNIANLVLSFFGGILGWVFIPIEIMILIFLLVIKKEYD